MHRSALQSVRNSIRAYMRLERDDSVDLAVLSAIVSNFAPDRVNPLWFVLIASSEAGKSMLLDVILEDWRPVWKMATTISPGYFFSGRTGEGALYQIDQAKKRLLYMRDMAALVSLPQMNKGLIHTQLIGIYDGDMKHLTGMHKVKDEQVHKRPPAERLGWIGAATEAFYDRFLARTYAVGARFTPFYWQIARSHWTNTEHLEKQRDLRDARLAIFTPTKQAVQAFLDEAIAQIGDIRHVTIPRVQAKRVDDATGLVMQIVGGGKTQPVGGRTSDRATQFARTAAFLSGEKVVEKAEGDLAVRLVLSQLAPEYQRLLGYAVRRENIGRWWPFAEFLREVAGRRIHYSEYRRGGPLEHMVDAGVLHVKVDRGKKYQEAARPMTIRITADALKLIQRFDPTLLELPRSEMTAAIESVRAEEQRDDSNDPAEPDLDRLLESLQ